MGYNTTVHIHNDALQTIEEHPEEAIQGIVRAIQSGRQTTVAVGNHGNPIEVMRTGHADEFRLYAENGNALLEINQYGGAVRLEELWNRSEHTREYVRSTIELARRTLDRVESHLKMHEKQI